MLFTLRDATFCSSTPQAGPALHVINSSLVDAMKKPPIDYGANTASACLLNNQSFHGVTLYCSRIYSKQKKNTGSNKERRKEGMGDGIGEGEGEKHERMRRKKERERGCE